MTDSGSRHRGPLAFTGKPAAVGGYRQGHSPEEAFFGQDAPQIPAMERLVGSSANENKQFNVTATRTPGGSNAHP